ncbi:MAG: NAD(P)-dependent oxidoreductase [Massiliimalia sp.]|jgi:phosphoglycerate dehydrogenase-like enzyme
MKFCKLAVIEPINVTEEAKQELYQYAQEVIFYPDLPQDDQEKIKRIGDADGVLVSFTTTIPKNVLEACPHVKYVGMCCSLYSPESANVDIRAAEALGITVTGVRDYGDDGVAEYAVSELARLLHGFGEHQWRPEQMEFHNLDIGFVGMGASGKLVSAALQYFGANIFYYSRTEKIPLREKGYTYLPLDELLQKVPVLITCLNKNVVLLGEREFQLFGNGKILMNTSISPSFDLKAVETWVQNKDNYLMCDSEFALGSGSLLHYPNVFCAHKTSGSTIQSKVRLGKKVIDNIEVFLNSQK